MICLYYNFHYCRTSLTGSQWNVILHIKSVVINNHPLHATLRNNWICINCFCLNIKNLWKLYNYYSNICLLWRKLFNNRQRRNFLQKLLWWNSYPQVLTLLNNSQFLDLCFRKVAWWKFVFTQKIEKLISSC